MNDSQLDNFFSDPKISKLQYLHKETNPLTIAYPREIQISNFLAWMMRPSEGHGLGDLPLRSLICAAWSAASEEQRLLMGQFTPSRLGQKSFSSSICIREYHLDSASRCDIIIIDQTNKLIIALENKYGATQGIDQLSKYQTALDSLLKKTSGWTKIFILMDFYQNAPDSDRWICIGYQWLEELIQQQIAMGHIADKSSQTLLAFLPHISADGDQTADPHGDMDELITHAATDHKAVLQEMGKFKKLTPRDATIQSTSTEPNPLLIEYLQRPALWNRVITTTRWAPLISKIKNIAPDTETDPKSKNLYICRASWLEHWTDHDDYWPAWIAIKRTSESKDIYLIEASIYMDRINEAFSHTALAHATSIRNRSNLRNISEGANRIALTRATPASESDVLPKVSKMIQLVNEVFDVD